MTTINCPLCIDNHLLRWCPKFRQMSPENRLRTTLIHRYCSNCLASNHSKDECDSVIRCKRCGSPHHTMLHGISSDVEELDEDVVELTWAQQVEAAEMEEETIATTDSIPIQPCQPTASVMQPRESSDQRCLSRIPHAQDRARLDSSRRLRRAGNFYSDWRHGNDRLRLDSSQRHYPDPAERNASRRPPRPKRRRGQGARRQADARRIIKDRHATLPWQQKIALSPTALIKIRPATRFITVRAMINPVSPSTVILASTITRLRLRTQARGDSRVCDFMFRDNHGGQSEISVTAKIQRHQLPPTPVRSLEDHTLQHFQNLRLADNDFYKSAPVEVILGADIYSRLILPGLQPATVGQLVAQNTTLGYVISGVV
ncbi:uncharacterized protein LOC128923458 [Zeugodacus cucurbitae]|uniref:uncharacterized protein LOC128923458 n=1 Tax=Zeugodacus cucurbitae TaxID=28588 RepID=UPI0023D96360|nr:uncharacterized protein LOC128923458 [Zeugodacus cucurbitae]